jgi:hypothetical protein
MCIPVNPGIMLTAKLDDSPDFRVNIFYQSQRFFRNPKVATASRIYIGRLCGKISSAINASFYTLTTSE